MRYLKHKKFLLILTFLMTQNAVTQEFDEGYLQSLPPEIQADVLKNIAQEADTKAELYRGPKTTVLQLDTALQQIKLQLTEIENELLDEEDGNQIIERFGKRFFKSFQSSFAPVEIANISDEYRVDVGDMFDITLVGQINESFAEIPVAKDGTITISNLGKFKVAGLNLGEVSDLVNKLVQQKIVGQEVFITLAELRDINILVVGGIDFPGMYTVSGNSNILSALDMAGGPSDNGSYRSILLKRNNEVIFEYDLYDVFINGNINFNHTLQAGDVILISPKGKEIAISGGVNNPAYYEIRSGETLFDAINFAKLTQNSNKNLITVERRLPDRTNIFTTTYEGSKSLEAMNSDNVLVDFINIKNSPLKSVEIRGEVINPGIYPISAQDTLSTLITRAGGYKSNAYPFAASLFRENTKIIEQTIHEKIYKDMITYLATAARTAQAAVSGSLPLLLAEFKSVQPLGRVTTEFNLDKLQQNKSLDITLQDGDVIEIPQYSPEVFVFGEVLNPGSKSFRASYKIKDYLQLAGGEGRLADKSKIILIHPNGDTFLHSGPLNLFKNDNVEVYPGSVVYVPRHIGKIEGVNYAATVAPIFSSLALSLASLNTISD